MRTPLLLTALAAVLGACDSDLVCPSAERVCGGRCVAVAEDPANCGACGIACGPLEVCTAGACACASDVVACGGGCVDVRIDPAHCGACDAACGDGLLCDGDGAGCVATCPADEDACGGGCVDLSVNARHCGACGHACAPGESCRGGACGADAIVACYWTAEAKPLTLDLAYGGTPFALGGNPASAVIHEGVLYTANGWPQASVDVVPLDGRDASTVQLPRDDLNTLAVHDGVLFVTNSAVGTLTLLDLSASILDEIPMPDQQSYPNPHGVGFVGASAYVALNDAFVGQKLVVVDLADLPACLADEGGAACDSPNACAADERCVAGTCRLACGRVARTIDLRGVPGAKDGEGLPFPSGVATVGSRVFVTLANLEWAQVTCDGFTYEWYVHPAGSGKLAVVDTAREDAVSVVDLGPGCGSPSAIEADGTTLWVSCGAYCYPDEAPGALVPVNVSGALPVVGPPLALAPAVAGEVAFCGGHGYVTDQRKTGAVVRFDPASGAVGTPVAICGADPYGNALASDVVCAR